MVKLLLSDTKVYPWTKANDIAFRGYFITGGVLYKDSNAIKYIEARLKVTSLIDILSELNGNFSIIVEDAAGIYFGTDCLGSLPLFYSYGKTETSLMITDNAQLIYNSLPIVTFDLISIEDYKKTGLFVTGQQTLFSEIKQVQAAELVQYSRNNHTLSYCPYFEYKHEDFDFDAESLKGGFVKAYKSVGENLVKRLDGRTAVIPLSGGADSRMVARLLKDMKYKKVICFTYGKKGNVEAEISKTIADELHYPWHMIQYTRKLWNSLRKDDCFIEYIKNAGNFRSLPHVQDFLAVKIMKESGILPDNAVFVPGHSGDLIAGSHITEEFLCGSLTPEEFLNTIYRKFYPGKELSGGLKKKVRAFFSESLETTIENLASYSEWFNIKERQSKFIVNSVRVYEHFGYEWLIPLWDSELFEYWKKVPIEWRYNRKLYFECVGDKQKSTNDVSYTKSLANGVRKIRPLRILARKISKVTKYFFSSLQIEGTFGLLPYMREAIKGDEFFTVNTVLNKYYLSLLKEKKNDSE